MTQQINLSEQAYLPSGSSLTLDGTLSVGGYSIADNTGLTIFSAPAGIAESHLDIDGSAYFLNNKVTITSSQGVTVYNKNYISWADAANDAIISISAAPTSAGYTLYLPSTIPTAGQVLSVTGTDPDSSGAWDLAWTSGGSGSPAGSDTQIQYNNAGAFGASAALEWVNAQQNLRLGDPTNTTSDTTIDLQGNGFDAVINMDHTTGKLLLNTTDGSTVVLGAATFNIGGSGNILLNMDGSAHFGAGLGGLNTDTGGNIASTATAIFGSAGPIDISAVLQADSGNRGFLPPRMSTVARNAITTPATGLQIYNTDTLQPEVYNGTSWVGMGGGGGGNITFTTITADTTLANTSGYYLINGGSTLNITLPDATTMSGGTVVVKNVTIQGVNVSTQGGQTVDGQTLSIALDVYQSIALTSDGANWLELDTTYATNPLKANNAQSNPVLGAAGDNFQVDQSGNVQAASYNSSAGALELNGNTTIDLNALGGTINLNASGGNVLVDTTVISGAGGAWQITGAGDLTAAGIIQFSAVNTSTNPVLTLSGQTGPISVSPGNSGSIYYDVTLEKFMVSENGGAYVSMLSAGGSPAGANGNVQFNGSGSFAANSNFNWDDTNHALQISHATDGVGIQFTTLNGDGAEINFAKAGGSQAQIHSIAEAQLEIIAPNGLNLFATNANVAIASTNGDVTFTVGSGGHFRSTTDLFNWSQADSSLSVGILYAGTSSVVPSAILQADSTTQGFLPPRMDSTARDAIASPATGLQIYNTTTNQPEVWNGSAWVAMAAGGSSDVTITFNTTNDTPAVAGSIPLNDNSVYEVTMTVTAVGGGTGNPATNAAAFVIRQAYKRSAGGDCVQIGGDDKLTHADVGTWDVNLVINTSSLDITVTGDPTDPVNWKIVYSLQTIGN